MATIGEHRGKPCVRVFVNGRWKRVRLKATEKRAQQREADEIERRLLDPTAQAAEVTTLDDAARLFIASRRRLGRAQGTLDMYDVKIANLGAVLGKNRPLSTLTPAVIDGYIDDRLAAITDKGTPTTRSTVGKELTALRGMLKQAKRAGKFGGDIKALFPTEWSSEYEPRTRTVKDLDHARLLIEYLIQPRRVSGKQRNCVNQAAMVAFILATGCRLGEAFRARPEDIDIAKRQVFIRVTKTRRKGRKDRYVPITRLTIGLIQGVLAATQARTGLLFDPWANVQRDIADACTALGIERLSPNDLRRTHSTWLVDRGIPAQMVADILGHMDTRMVERVYGRMTPEALKTNVTHLLGEGDRAKRIEVERDRARAALREAMLAISNEGACDGCAPKDGTHEETCKYMRALQDEKDPDEGTEAAQ